MLDERPSETLAALTRSSQPTTSEMAIKMRAVSKRLGQVQALREISFAIPHKQMVAIL